MRSSSLRWTVMAAALCVACASGSSGTEAPGSNDASAFDAPMADASAGDSTPPAEDSGMGPQPSDAAGETMAQDTGEPEDAGSVDTGADETGVTDAGVDAGTCSVGPGPGANYQATCTGCSISATCLLTCASCTTKNQMQNPNPSLELPCPAAESVQNIDGVLTCQ